MSEYFPEDNEANADRLPPHSLECEQGVIGCILIDAGQTLPICIEKLKDGSDTFYDLRHKSIYETLIELYEDGVGIDLINLQERLRMWDKLEQVGGVAYLSSLTDAVPSVVNAEDYIRTVCEKYTLRKMIQTCTEVVGRIYDNDGDVEELIDTCERDILRISEARAESPNLSMPVLMHEVIAEIEYATQHQGSPTGLLTGFTDLDNKTGGFQPGQMIVIAARPAMGKSSLAMNIVDHVAVNLHQAVGVVSLEMTGRELVRRAVAGRSRVNLGNMRDGFLADRDYPKITAAAGALLHAPIYIEDRSGLSILQIRAKFRRWKQQHDIKLGVIDYLQLANAIGNKRKFESRQQEVSDISTGCKNLAKELGIPLIVLSQMNREYEKEKNRKPRLSDLRESGSIEQDADVVAFLYRPKTEDDDDPDEAMAMNLLIAKNRNGSTGDVNLVFVRQYTRFESASSVSESDVPHHQPQPTLPYEDPGPND